MKTYSGINNHGDTIILPGKWEEKPTIQVSPFTLAVPPTITVNPDEIDERIEATYPYIQVAAENIIETPPGSGKWQFDVFCATTNNNISKFYYADEENVDKTLDIWYSKTYSTVPVVNPEAILISGVITSKIGNDSGFWIVRQVDITLQKEVTHGVGDFIDVATVTTAPIDHDGIVPWSIDYKFPTAGDLTYRLKFEAKNVLDSGGFPIIYGELNYNYSQENLQTTYPITTPNLSLLNNPVGSHNWVAITFNFSPTQAGEIYKIEYSVNSFSVAANTTAAGILNGGFSWEHKSTETVLYSKISTRQHGGSDLITSPIAPWSGVLENVALPDMIENLQLVARLQVYGNTSHNSSLTFTSTKPISATVYRRQPIINSQTPENHFVMLSKEITSAGEPIATGSAQWLAIGNLA